MISFLESDLHIAVTCAEFHFMGSTLSKYEKKFIKQDLKDVRDASAAY